MPLAVFPGLKWSKGCFRLDLCWGTWRQPGKKSLLLTMATTNGHKIMRKSLIVVRIEVIPFFFSCIERHASRNAIHRNTSQRPTTKETTRRNRCSKIKSHFERQLDYNLKWAQTKTSWIVAISGAESGWVTWMTSWPPCLLLNLWVLFNQYIWL